jgi:hypothetical protein
MSEQSFFVMEERDYFAGQALAPIVAHALEKFGKVNVQDIKIAYQIADAMMVEKEFKSIEPTRGIFNGVDEDGN